MSASLPQRWLDKADEDLIVARLVLREGHTAHACFLAQQCIEKSLKAYLLATAHKYPRTHKLVDLLHECIGFDQAFSQFLADCAVVDQYYIPTRYPDSVPGNAQLDSPNASKAEEAITASERILRFVAQHVP